MILTQKLLKFHRSFSNKMLSKGRIDCCRSWIYVEGRHLLNRAYLEKGVKLEIKHTSGLITWILLLYHLVIDHSNILIVRFTMLADYCFKIQTTKTVQLGWGIFFFYVCCWFFLIGFTFDRPIIILETTGGYRWDFNQTWWP